MPIMTSLYNYFILGDHLSATQVADKIRPSEDLRTCVNSYLLFVCVLTCALLENR